jgi:hypothetical protein
MSDDAYIRQLKRHKRLLDQSRRATGAKKAALLGKVQTSTNRLARLDLPASRVRQTAFAVSQKGQDAGYLRNMADAARGRPASALGKAASEASDRMAMAQGHRRGLARMKSGAMPSSPTTLSFLRTQLAGDHKAIRSAVRTVSRRLPGLAIGLLAAGVFGAGMGSRAAQAAPDPNWRSEAAKKAARTKGQNVR